MLPLSLWQVWGCATKSAQTSNKETCLSEGTEHLAQLSGCSSFSAACFSTSILDSWQFVVWGFFFGCIQRCGGITRKKHWGSRARLKDQRRTGITCFPFFSFQFCSPGEVKEDTQQSFPRFAFKTKTSRFCPPARKTLVFRSVGFNIFKSHHPPKYKLSLEQAAWTNPNTLQPQKVSRPGPPLPKQHPCIEGLVCSEVLQGKHPSHPTCRMVTSPCAGVVVICAWGSFWAKKKKVRKLS